MLSTAKMTTPISAIIISKNEEAHIGDCLASLFWVDEIIVVDSGSTDRTEAICMLNEKVRFFYLPWQGFGAQKQSAVALATNNLVFSIDCDERVTPELAHEIKNILYSGKVMTAYSVSRRTFIGNKEIKHCGWYPNRGIRLFDRRFARFSNRAVHEKVEFEGDIGNCKEHILHYSYTGIGHMIIKLNHYSDLSARHMRNQGRSSGVPDLILRPLIAFLKVYVWKAGFLDGIAGLTISVTSAYSTYVKYMKLLELSAEPGDTSDERPK